MEILKLNKKRVASIGTLGINTGKYKKNVSNTTLDPIELSSHLEKIKKQRESLGSVNLRADEETNKYQIEIKK